MLGDEHRVAAKRRLFAVIGDDRRRKPLGDEILGVGEHHGQAFALQVGEVFSPQVKAVAEGRFDLIFRSEPPPTAINAGCGFCELVLP